MKTYKLNTMIGGIDGYGNPCKSIGEQVAEILAKKKNYKFDALAPHETRTINTREVTLFIKKRKKKK